MADEETKSGIHISAGLIGVVLVAALLVIFIFQNTQKETVELYFWEVTAQLWVVLLGTAGVTLLLAGVASFTRKRRR